MLNLKLVSSWFHWLVMWLGSNYLSALPITSSMRWQEWQYSCHGLPLRTRWIQPYRSFGQCLTHSDHSIIALTAEVVIIITVWIGDNDACNIDLWKLNKSKCLTCSKNSVWVNFPQMAGTLSAYAVWTPEDGWHSASRSCIWLCTENYWVKRQNLKSK